MKKRFLMTLMTLTIAIIAMAQRSITGKVI